MFCALCWWDSWGEGFQWKEMRLSLLMMKYKQVKKSVSIHEFISQVWFFKKTIDIKNFLNYIKTNDR